jgi:hypothetical protein
MYIQAAGVAGAQSHLPMRPRHAAWSRLRESIGLSPDLRAVALKPCSNRGMSACDEARQTSRRGNVQPGVGLLTKLFRHTLGGRPKHHSTVCIKRSSSGAIEMFCCPL